MVIDSGAVKYLCLCIYIKVDNEQGALILMEEIFGAPTLP